MEKRMKAARLHEMYKPLQIDEVPVPEIEDEDVLINVKACGLNGGDPHLVTGDIRLRPEDEIPIPRLPITIGHEAAGFVAEVGRKVRAFKEGDRAFINPSLCCSRCYYCQTDQEQLCESFGVLGFTSFALTEEGRELFEKYREGAAAEYVKVPARNVLKVPDQIPFDQAGKISTLAVGYRAAKVARVRPGETVVVIGATGGSGITAVMCARLFGATRIIAVAKDEGRLKKLQDMIGPGIVETVSVRENISQKILELTNGNGADVLIDYLPRGVEVTEQAIFSMRNGGRVVLVGGCTEILKLPYRYLMIKSLEIRSSKGFASYEIPELFNLVTSGSLDLSGLVTHRFPLEEINQALHVVDKRIGDPLWVAVEPRRS